MDVNNLAVVRGIVSSGLRTRELPAGAVVTQFDVTTRSAGLTTSVPVACYDHTVDAVAGDEVLVTGHVRRRFFRAGGVTHSRTELVADQVLRISRRRAVEKAIVAAIDLLAA